MGFFFSYLSEKFVRVKQAAKKLFSMPACKVAGGIS